MSTYTPSQQHFTDLSMDQLCRMCAVNADYILELVQEGVIAPVVLAGNSDIPETWRTWRFTSLHLRYTKVASRLQRDLGVNLAGAALALQLLDELETLRAQLVATQAIEVLDAT